MAREASRKAQCMNNIRQIAAAFHLEKTIEQLLAEQIEK
jgi:hypothetical protein